MSLGTLFSVLLCTVLVQVYAAEVFYNFTCDGTACITNGLGTAYVVTNSTVTGNNVDLYCSFGDSLNITLAASVAGHPWRVLAGGADFAGLAVNPVTSFPDNVAIACDQTACDAGALTYKCDVHPAMTGNIFIENCPTPTPTPTPFDGSYRTVYTYQGGDCSQAPYEGIATFEPCVIGQGPCDCPVGGAGCTITECSADLPVPPSGSLIYVVYDAPYCQGTPTTYGAYHGDGCYASADGTRSFIYSCNNFGLHYNIWNNAQCSGNPIADAGYSAGCLTYGSTSIYTSCSPPCFHEETEINYEGKMYTLDKFLAEKENPKCAVPHIQEFSVAGVKITTDCDSKALRLTHEHLVFTAAGMKAAGDVKVGDKLFRDLAETQTCQVTAVQGEIGQRYFALNCEESIVLANGYKTSTFGITHDIPSFWMKYASKVIGIQRASQIGDYVATLLSKLGLL